MNRCKNCGAEFDSPFCPYCGTKAEETTPYQESKKDNETPAPEAQAGKHEAENTPATSPTAPESTASNAAPEPAGDPVVGIPQPNAASNSADEQPETPPATSHTQGGPSPMPPKGPIAPQHATQESDNAEFQPPSQPDKEPVYIYKKLWFIGLITFLCPIAGIILAVVQKKPAKKAERAALIVVACIWMIAGIAIMGSMGSSSSTTGTASSTSSTSSSYNSSSQTSTTTPKKAEKKLSSITATYSGDTLSGTTIDDSNTGITVKASYSDGTSQTVTGWTVTNPGTLVGGSTNTFDISYQGKTCTLEIVPKLTEDEYKASCSEYSYEDLARNPDDYEGADVVFTGKVVQVLEGTSSTSYRINVTKGSYGIWDDTVMVVASKTDSGSRILEDDIVTFYGTYGGLYSYESVMGATITVPLVLAQYGDLN